MRKIFDLILVGLFFLFLFWQRDNIGYNVNFLTSSPCDKPITYKIGEVDKGYGLTDQQFMVKVDKASQIWSSVAGKNLFAFDPEGKIVINLIYTERQAMVDNLNNLEENLEGGRTSLDSMKAEYKSLAADFEKRLAVFNQEVSFWNKQGGAPEDVYNRLTQEQSELKTQADKLNNLARQLNLSVEEYNSQVGEFNQNLQTYKEVVSTKPEAGLFDGSIPKIDIYLTSSDQELIHTLAHEFGHALGLAHVEDPQSIMYPWTNEIIEPAGEEAESLEAYCGRSNLDLRLDQLKKNLNTSP